jgi:hypothetical protein
MLLSFGQPDCGIIQIAYVVRDIRQSIAYWLDLLDVGPWYLQERWAPGEAEYQGERSKAEVAAALSFSGHTQIELIQPLDDHPSVYREVIETKGYGFHHVARGSVNYARDVHGYIQKGYPLAFQARVPTGSLVGYIDTRDVLPGYTELIEQTQANDRFFTNIYKAALDWDGSEPIRHFG